MMMISNRTKISIEQFLSIMNDEIRGRLSNKYGNNDYDLVQEIISTKNFLRNQNIALRAPAATFDERLQDLERCLLLDGYKTENSRLIQIEATIDGVIAFEDDLTNEIEKTSLRRKKKIIKAIQESAEYFKSEDYNGCLSNARIALETIARDWVYANSEVETMWGEALRQLQNNNVLTVKDEKMIANTYTFISDGSHTHLGFEEKEYTMYARNLCISMCYFLVKKINGQL